jgi:hypothetical protein
VGLDWIGLDSGWFGMLGLDNGVIVAQELGGSKFGYRILGPFSGRWLVPSSLDLGRSSWSSVVAWWSFVPFVSRGPV